MTSSTQYPPCPECYPPEGHILWRDLPVNETLRAHVQAYISPVAVYYFTLDEAMAEWGTNIEPEDLL